MVYKKSLTKELTYTAIGIFVVLLAILTSTQSINLLGRAAEGRVAVEAIMALIGFWSLGLFPVMLIITVFISILTVMTRYWRDHEMSVWLSSGLSIHDWVKPILRFALPFAILVGFMSTIVTPWATLRSKEYAEILKQREELSAIAPGVFKEVGKDKNIYFIEKFSPETGAAENIFVQNNRSDGKPSTLLAKTGYLLNKLDQRLLVLENGHRYSGEPGTANFEEIYFDRFDIVISSTPKLIVPITDRQTIPTKALINSEEPQHKAELLWRLSLPISVLILAYLAVPLSYFNPRTGHTYNLVFALVIYLFYQNGITFLRNMVADGKLSFAIALPLMHIIIVILAWLLIRYRNQPAGPFLLTLSAILKKS